MPPPQSTPKSNLAPDRRGHYAGIESADRPGHRHLRGMRMGIDDLVNQGKEFLEQNKEKIDETIHSEQAEGVSDSVLDAAADFVKKIAPDSMDEQIDGVRNSIDSAIGNE